MKNKVPYNIFSKWYKDTRKQIVEVKVDFDYKKLGKDMAADEKDRFIQYLVDKVNMFSLDTRPYRYGLCQLLNQTFNF